MLNTKKETISDKLLSPEASPEARSYLTNTERLKAPKLSYWLQRCKKVLATNTYPSLDLNKNESDALYSLPFFKKFRISVMQISQQSYVPVWQKENGEVIADSFKI